MNDKQINAKPSESVPTGNGASVEYQQEREQLRHRIQELEAERDEYRHALVAVLAAQVKEEDITIPDEKDCLPFEAFAHELDAIVDKE